MQQIMLGLASGILGAILGAWAAFKLNKDNARAAAIENMLSLVYPIGFKSWWQPEQGKPALIFHDQYPALWSAYARLRSALPRRMRKKCDDAWHQYMAIDYYDQIPEDQPSKVFSKGTHKTREEAIKRSAEFIKYLVALR